MAIIPYLFYEDVGAALAFLSKAFGFKRHGPRMKDRDGTIRHAAMQFGDATVMMGWPGPDYRSPKRTGYVSQNLYVTVDDADKHYRRAVKAGAVIVEEPGDTEYGARRYGAADPEGHVWYFAHEL